ncbi:hypothetical protein [Xanthomonas cannabis]|uniref:hypothetical protein n=1 Tax=Xanthomonas cannabis TaxID=1885674 RepID=UPI00141A6D8E|nr:hypothetical protein [Xanthomonas cannabis]NIK00368.1 hypothetical protein [Xanthomonas cannabis]
MTADEQLSPIVFGSEKESAPEVRAGVSDQPDSTREKLYRRVGKLLRYRNIEKEMLSLHPDLDLLDFIQAQEIPLYVGIDRSIHIAYIKYEGGMFPRRGFRERVNYFRLNAMTIQDLQRADGCTACLEFERGGLQAVDKAETAPADNEEVSFTRGYVISRSDKKIVDKRGFESEPDWSELAISYLVDLENVYIQKQGVDLIRKDFTPDMLDFPPSLEGVTDPIRMVYQAAYQLQVKKAAVKDVEDSLKDFNAEVFRVKRLEQAMGLVHGDLRKSRSGIEKMKFEMNLGGLEEPAEDSCKFFSQNFLTSELKSIILISAWWSNYAAAADDGLIHVLKARLEMMGFSPSRLPHLIKLIIGGTKWKGCRIDEMLEEKDLSASIEKYP